MPALERSESSNCSNPVIDVFLRIGGVLTDPYSLEYIIYELETVPGTPTQTYPPAGRATVDLNGCPTGHRLSLGRFVAEWDVPADQVVGDHLIRWFFQETAVAVEKTWDQEFNVTLPMAASPSVGYCTVQDIRDEGITDTELTNTRAEMLISQWSQWFDKVTGQFFAPVNGTIDFDGDGTRLLLLPFPIITCDNLYINDDFTNAVDADFYTVYNGRSRLQDDRRNPHIMLTRATPSDTIFTASSARIFEIGDRNQRVDGTFGYVEEDDSVPGPVQNAVKVLVVATKDMLADDQIDQLIGGRIIEEVTDRHRVEYADLFNRLKAWNPTGITAVDMAIRMYRAPTRVNAPRTMMHPVV
jgi:hypothetical protein